MAFIFAISVRLQVEWNEFQFGEHKEETLEAGELAQSPRQ